MIYLPYEDYDRSAEVLDPMRLKDQCAEILTVAELLLRKPRGVWNPGIEMWRGYSSSLIDFGVICCEEWRARGNTDTIVYRLEDLYPLTGNDVGPKPPWLGDEKVHRSHQSLLLRLAKRAFEATGSDNSLTRYQAFGDIPDDLPIYYPVEE